MWPVIYWDSGIKDSDMIKLQLLLIINDDCGSGIVIKEVITIVCTTVDRKFRRYGVNDAWTTRAP